MLTKPSYGTRGRQINEAEGVRQIARTYGKARISIYVEKAGQIVVESEAERLVAHLLSVDPYVRSFRAQPFTVDIEGNQLLFTKEEIAEVRKARGSRNQSEYTPDFAIVNIDGHMQAIEVKLQGYEGNTDYIQKLERAKEIMNANAYEFRIITVPVDERHPVRVNAQLLKTSSIFGKTHLTEELIHRVEKYCETGPVLQGDMCAELKLNTGLILPLLLAGVVKADLSQKLITNQLILESAFGELEHLRLIQGLQS